MRINDIHRSTLFTKVPSHSNSDRPEVRTRGIPRQDPRIHPPWAHIHGPLNKAQNLQLLNTHFVGFPCHNWPSIDPTPPILSTEIYKRIFMILNLFTAGHICSLQLRESTVGPVHLCPFRQTRCLVRCPPPQLAEQRLHSVQSVHWLHAGITQRSISVSSPVFLFDSAQSTIGTTWAISLGTAGAIASPLSHPIAASDRTTAGSPFHPVGLGSTRVGAFPSCTRNILLGRMEGANGSIWAGPWRTNAICIGLDSFVKMMHLTSASLPAPERTPEAM